MQSFVRVILALVLFGGGLCPAFCLMSAAAAAKKHACCPDRSHSSGSKPCGQASAVTPALPEASIAPAGPATLPQRVLPRAEAFIFEFLPSGRFDFHSPPRPLIASVLRI